ncbi:hypothetical protein B0H67DRAFT_644052 [Lasiosphaeris hirsuta]|uniref:Uncharacterized protein n=1 Tax=Lasiosphaeris hirsuta TaxID=260670 RepID=A0AA40ARU5_9PEZI|nr:hypothetical protein B0H67DRAFT_644052 [Lasiosphaeris hirsuta]
MPAVKHCQVITAIHTQPDELNIKEYYFGIPESPICSTYPLIMVIGLDLEYRKNKGKEARVIVWRPERTKKTFEGIFRNTDGSLANGKRNLRIWLKDFGNKLDCPGIQKVQGAITISFTQLYELVQDSEVMEQTRKRRRGSDEVLTGGSKKRMVRPAPERLTTSDEERFGAAEEVAKQLSDQDGDYIPK